MFFFWWEEGTEDMYLLGGAGSGLGVFVGWSGFSPPPMEFTPSLLLAAACCLFAQRVSSGYV